jgi:FKBP-type peptidyl-prolyl cis-trans isomerase (trigger factor)
MLAREDLHVLIQRSIESNLDLDLQLEALLKRLLVEPSHESLFKELETAAHLYEQNVHSICEASLTVLIFYHFSLACILFLCDRK